MKPAKSAEQIAFAPDTAPADGAIDASYLTVEFAKAAWVREAEVDLERLRDITGRHSEDLGVDILLVDFQFILTDRDVVLATVLVHSLLMAGAGVFGSLLLFVHPLLALFIFSVVVLIDVDLFGLMVIWDMKVDVTAFTSVAMALGLSVDYVVHIAAAFVQQKGDITLPERLMRTYVLMGVSVFNGGFSTLLGIVLLSAA